MIQLQPSIQPHESFNLYLGESKLIAENRNFWPEMELYLRNGGCIGSNTQLIVQTNSKLYNNKLFMPTGTYSLFFSEKERTISIENQLLFYIKTERGKINITYKGLTPKRKGR